MDQYRALLPVLLYPRGQVVSHKVLRMARRKLSDASKVSRDFWSKHTNLSQELNQAFLAQRPPGNLATFASPSIVQSQLSPQHFLKFVAQFTGKSTRDKSIQKLPFQVSNCVHGIDLQVNVFCDMFDFTERSIVGSSDWIVGDYVRIEL